MARNTICIHCNNLHKDTEKCSCRAKVNSKFDYQKQDGFYYSKKWRKTRLSIINRDEGSCQRCLIKYNRITTSSLEVHHIKPRSKYEHLQFEPTNLVTLCKTCNLQLGVQEQLDFPLDVEARENEREYHL